MSFRNRRLNARHLRRCAGGAPIDASRGRLTADLTGEVETEEGVLVTRGIHVAMRLKAPEQAKETVERVHSNYAMYCLYTGRCIKQSRSLNALIQRPEQSAATIPNFYVD